MKARERPAWLARDGLAPVLLPPLLLPLPPLCSGKRCVGWGKAPSDAELSALELGEEAPLFPAPTLEVPVFGPPSEAGSDAPDFGLRPVIEAAAAFAPMAFDGGVPPSVTRDAVLAAAEGLVVVPELCSA